ncbi:L,D-transpeptidase family protein [Caenimonas koreensis]|uniref:L,D-transpeptidase family protein n=1 Tax=Caenimonas koreensis TaxID=367474 RepID=UPI0037847553
MPSPHAFTRLAASLLCLSLAIAGAPATAATGKTHHGTGHHTSPQAASAAAKAFDFDAFNSATDTPLLKTGSKGPAVARAQILLDRAWFSVGEIDGRYAANMQRIVRAYQLARGLQATGTVTTETWQALREEGAMPLTRYTLTDKDVAGPFEKTPAKMADRALLKSLPYESLDEAMAEKFHASVAYIKSLNGGASMAAGSEIIVPNVRDTKPPVKGASIEIDKQARVLYVLDAGKRPIAAFPISIGKEDRDPLPLGSMAIKTEVKNPTFTYDPKLLKDAPRDAAKMDIPAGPNNPVGTIWMGLSKPHWGIHGTSNPSNVGHSETNGCIHLTNWDAERLSQLAKAGFKVEVKA